MTLQTNVVETNQKYILATLEVHDFWQVENVNWGRTDDGPSYKLSWLTSQRSWKEKWWARSRLTFNL